MRLKVEVKSPLSALWPPTKGSPNGWKYCGWLCGISMSSNSSMFVAFWVSVMRCVSPHYRSILMLSTKKCPLASGPIYSANETDFRYNFLKVVTRFYFRESTGNFVGLIWSDFFRNGCLEKGTVLHTGTWNPLHINIWAFGFWPYQALF